jgi:hypothetical protein
MSINSPQYPGQYSRRATDCELAIERDFFKVLVEARTSFVDLDAILMTIADDAIRAGWSEKDLTEAVLALSKRHRLATTPRRF